jgi:hypothetical protein
MKQNILVLTLVGALFLVLNVSIAEAASKKFKVLFVVVPTSEEDLVSQTKSYIARELRGLKDVELGGKDPGLEGFFISIFPLSLKLSNGVTTGIAVSYVFEKDERRAHNVLVGGPNDLKVLCEKVIAYFDTYWLEPERRK